MSNRQQFFAAAFLALLLAAVSYYVAFAPISVHYTESASLDRNWERLSSLAVRHLRVYGGSEKRFEAVRAVIYEGAQNGDRLKLAASQTIPGVEAKFEPDGAYEGPALVVQRAGGTLTAKEVNQVLEAVQFSTDSRRPTDDLSRNIRLVVLEATGTSEGAEQIAKAFDFVVQVTGQNDIPRVRFVDVASGRTVNARAVTLASREPVKLGDLFDRVDAGDGDRYDFFTVDLGVKHGKLGISGKGLPGNDFAGAPLAWSETLPYTEREEYFLDVAGKHVRLQSRDYSRVARLIRGTSADPWGISYVPPSEGSASDLLTIRVNDHGDGVGHAAAESVQEISIQLVLADAEQLPLPSARQVDPKRKVYMEVVRLEHRQAKELVPILRDILPQGSSVDAKQNTLILKGTPEALQEMRDSARQLDVPLRNIRIRYVRAAAVERFLSASRQSDSVSATAEDSAFEKSAFSGACPADGKFGAGLPRQVLERLSGELVAEANGLEGQPQDLISMDARLPIASGSGADEDWSGQLDDHHLVKIKIELTAHLLGADRLILVAHQSMAGQHPDPAAMSGSSIRANASGLPGEWLYIDSTCGAAAPSGAQAPPISLFVRVDLI